MSQREKLLAILVGVSLLVLVATYGGKSVMRVFSDRDATMTQLKKSISKKKVAIVTAKRARDALTVYENRSLPGDPVLASSRYRAWLHDWAEQCGISEENVRCESVRTRRNQYNSFTFSMSCEGDLRHMVRLLHEFYSVDYLHRIKQLTMRPLKDQKKMALAFRIETLSLPTAAKDKALGDLPSHRLAFDSVDQYYNVIVNRNPYAPANEPPRFVSTSRITGYLNQPLTIRPEVKDPENNRVSYRLGDVELEGLKFDEQSGRIEWTPSAKGEFEIPLIAVDDGLPSKETATTLRVEVTDPPPPEPEKRPPPAFDKAKFAFVTGIVEVNGIPQVWIDCRTEGKLLKLKEGDDIVVGLFQGKIEHIYPKKVDIRAGDKVYSIKYGQNLTQGQTVSTPPDAGGVAAGS